MKWNDALPRTNIGLWVDRGLAVYLTLLIAVNFFNLYQISDIASWEEIRVLVCFSLFICAVVPMLWKSYALGTFLTFIFYALQVPSTVALYTFFYDFDGGLKVALGYLHQGLHFSFFFFHTNLSMGLLDAKADGTAYGLMINLAALVLVVYYYRRLHLSTLKTDQLQPNS